MQVWAALPKPNTFASTLGVPRTSPPLADKIPNNKVLDFPRDCDD